MPYCSYDDLKKAYGEAELVQLTDRNGAGVVDGEVLDAAITAADAEINQRLRAKGWTLPIAASSPDLLHIAQDITRLFLHVNQPPKSVSDAFDRAVKKLDNYVKGLVDLDLGSPATAAVSGAGDVAFTKNAGDRIFTKETLQGF